MSELEKRALKVKCPFVPQSLGNDAKLFTFLTRGGRAQSFINNDLIWFGNVEES